jgi:LPXTG-motif cell wall-anchored protein
MRCARLEKMGPGLRWVALALVVLSLAVIFLRRKK